MKKFTLVFFATLIGFPITSFGQLLNPMCGQGYFFKSGGGQCITYYGTGDNTSTGTTQNLPGYAEGLAIGPSFGFTAPNPTYWTVVSGIYYYYNGSAFVSSGHSAGGASFTNPGGSNDYIYNINNLGQISVYNGTSNASILTTLAGFTGTSVVQDIVGDNNNNFYLLKTSAPAGLIVFNSAGVPTCTYNIPGTAPSGMLGLAITNNRVLVGGVSSYIVGTLNGNDLSFSSGGNLNCLPNDLAACPSECNLAPSITSTPAALSCSIAAVTLSSTDLSGSNSYTWAGPGVAGSAFSQSVQVNATGVYTRTTYNCQGLFHTSTFTVGYDSALPQISTYQAAVYKCSQDAAVMLAVNGLTNFSWTPSASLSSSSGPIVYANPSVTTSYTVTGVLNGCVNSTVITLKAQPMPAILPSVSDPTICSGSQSTLSASSAPLNYLWQPGNLTGSMVVVAPGVSTTYTLTGTDILGCTDKATVPVMVVSMPALVSTVSDEQICSGDAITISSAGAANYITNPGSLAGPLVTIYPTTNTIYTVTANNWICAATKTIGVVVDPLPVVSASLSSSIVCAGEPVTISASGANSYLWNTQESSATIMVNPQATTVYSVKGTDSNGCAAEYFITLEVNACTAISENGNIQPVVIFPNPSAGRFYLRYANSPVQVEIFGADGRLVHSVRMASDDLIDLSRVAEGIYHLRILEDGRLLHQANVQIAR